MSEDTDNTMHLVHYVQNTEASSNTGVIAFHEEDRDDISLGQVGYVTEAELYRLGVYGVVLTPISEDEANELALTVPALRGAYAVTTAPAAPAPVKPVDKDKTDTSVPVKNSGPA